MKLLAVIPARGGSKGISRKNIRQIAGKPLLAWSIEEAKKVNGIDCLICSTEDQEIATIARTYGCEVPFVRPERLSGDFVPGAEVLCHAFDFFRDKGVYFDAGIYLQCTTPLRTAASIQQAIDTFVEKGLTSLAGICPVEFPLEWTFSLTDKNILDSCMSGSQGGKPMQRQRFRTVYRPNGAIYIIAEKSLKKHRSFINPETYGFIMSRLSSIDIDDEFDLEVAHLLLSARQASNGAAAGNALP